jgi:hypothetical protein
MNLTRPGKLSLTSVAAKARASSHIVSTTPSISLNDPEEEKDRAYRYFIFTRGRLMSVFIFEFIRSLHWQFFESL